MWYISITTKDMSPRQVHAGLFEPQFIEAGSFDVRKATFRENPGCPLMSKPDFKTAVRQEEAYLRLIYPTADDIPGCISLFDTYLSCNVIRAQVKSLYRYGQRPECSQKLEDFKFCLTLKSSHPEERRDAWITRRAEWWAHRRLGKSSEDIWDIRDEPLKSFPRPITEELRSPPIE